MLLEIHYDFVIANLSNLTDLDMLILPSEPNLTKDQAKKIEDWASNGGKLLVIGKGAMDQEKKGFLMDMGVEYVSESPFNFDYSVIKKDIGENIVTTPFLNYESGMQLELSSAEKLASIREPYFNRTYATYSSHRETPYKLEDSEYPAIVRKGNIILFAHDLDKLYYEHGVRLHRELFKNAIDILYDSPVLKVRQLPSAGRVSFLKQETKNRYVAHVLYAPALTRGEVQVIEDLVPVSGVEIEVAVPEKIKQVMQIPQMKDLPFKNDNGRIKVTIPQFSMHTGIVMKY
jgi:hypothetical protein